jgi:hypothetical protein
MCRWVRVADLRKPTSWELAGRKKRPKATVTSRSRAAALPGSATVKVEVLEVQLMSAV